MLGKRLEFQYGIRINRVGVADKRFNPAHADPFWPCFDRWPGLRFAMRRRPDIIGLIKPRRPRLPGFGRHVLGLVAGRFQDCLQAQNPAGGNGRVHAVAPRPGEKHLRRAKGLDKIMGLLANPELRLLHAEDIAHRPVKPRARVRQPGPCSFI